jgi:hypothetical protein
MSNTPEKKTRLTLEVGATYHRRDGATITITELGDPGDRFRFRGECPSLNGGHDFWDIHGKFMATGKSRFDLLAKVVTPFATPIPAGTKARQHPCTGCQYAEWRNTSTSGAHAHMESCCGMAGIHVNHRVDARCNQFTAKKPAPAVEEVVPKTKSALSIQIAGDHYKKLGIQPVEYIQANKIPYMEGNAIKYLTRWRDKGGIADLEKARHYIDMLIEFETKAAK